MRAAFLGTPSAAVPSLLALTDVASVELVITQPDAARGRSGRPVPPPVKVAAGEFGFTVAQPLTHDELRGVLEAVEVDVAVIVAYGRILRPDALAAVPLGFVNVHFSLLPRWRGAAPVERAILAGDDRTGVTLMVLDEGMDTGPLLAVHETAIAEHDTGGSLTARLAHQGAVLLADVLPEYVRGRVDPVPQMESGSTHAVRLTTAEAQILPTTEAEPAMRMMRAFTPRPGAWAVIDGTRTKLWNAVPGDADIPPGSIDIIDGAPHLGLRGGTIELVEIQPAGKRILTGVEWANGRQGAPAELTAE